MNIFRRHALKQLSRRPRKFAIHLTFMMHADHDLDVIGILDAIVAWKPAVREGEASPSPTETEKNYRT